MELNAKGDKMLHSESSFELWGHWNLPCLDVRYVLYVRNFGRDIRTLIKIWTPYTRTCYEIQLKFQFSKSMSRNTKHTSKDDAADPVELKSVKRSSG